MIRSTSYITYESDVRRYILFVVRIFVRRETSPPLITGKLRANQNSSQFDENSRPDQTSVCTSRSLLLIRAYFQTHYKRVSNYTVISRTASRHVSMLQRARARARILNRREESNPVSYENSSALIVLTILSQNIERRGSVNLVAGYHDVISADEENIRVDRGQSNPAIPGGEEGTSRLSN